MFTLSLSPAFSLHTLFSQPVWWVRYPVCCATQLLTASECVRCTVYGFSCFCGVGVCSAYVAAFQVQLLYFIFLIRLISFSPTCNTIYSQQKMLRLREVWCGTWKQNQSSAGSPEGFSTLCDKRSYLSQIHTGTYQMLKPGRSSAWISAKRGSSRHPTEEFNQHMHALHSNKKQAEKPYISEPCTKCGVKSSHHSH